MLYCTVPWRQGNGGGSVRVWVTTFTSLPKGFHAKNNITDIIFFGNEAVKCNLSHHQKPQDYKTHMTSPLPTTVLEKPMHYHSTPEKQAQRELTTTHRKLVTVAPVGTAVPAARAPGGPHGPTVVLLRARVFAVVQAHEASNLERWLIFNLTMDVPLGYRLCVYWRPSPIPLALQKQQPP